MDKIFLFTVFGRHFCDGRNRLCSQHLERKFVMLCNAVCPNICVLEGSRKVVPSLESIKKMSKVNSSSFSRAVCITVY